MTTEDQLIQTVYQAKCWVSCRALDLANQDLYGSDTICCEKKLFLMCDYINIVDNYYCANFGANGNITATSTCLTWIQVQDVLSKMKTMIK